MTPSKGDTQPSAQDVALIVGGGPGISSSCARLFAENGMRVCVAARNPEKAVLEALEKTHGVRRYACDASEPAAVAQLFGNVVQDIVHGKRDIGNGVLDILNVVQDIVHDEKHQGNAGNESSVSTRRLFRRI